MFHSPGIRVDLKSLANRIKNVCTEGDGHEFNGRLSSLDGLLLARDCNKQKPIVH
jgi:hypothetical protein